MTYFLRIFFLRRSALVSVIFFSLALLVLLLFNSVRNNLHGVFWQRMKLIFPDHYLVPNEEAISLDDWEKLSPKEEGIELSPLCSVPAVIEFNGRVKGVMLLCYLDLSGKMNRHKSVFKGESTGIVAGEGLLSELGAETSDEVKIFLMDSNGRFRVSGKAVTGFFDYDTSYLFADMSILENLEEPAFISEVEVYGEKGRINALTRNLKGLELESFWQRNPELEKAFRTEKLFFGLCLNFFRIAIFLVLLFIYQLRLEQVRKDILTARILGMNPIRLFSVLTADLFINFHAGLLISIITAFFLYSAVPVISLPEGVYGIDSICLSLSNSFDVSEYLILLLFIILLSVSIFTKLMQDDIIKKIN